MYSNGIMVINSIRIYSMESIWTCSMESIWTCPWNPWWICLHSIWNPVESIWNSDGFHMELTIPWPFHDDSIWNPWCPWNNELAVVSANIDSMDSRWNSRWIPWIPGGFHMDYTREGKDLFFWLAAETGMFFFLGMMSFYYQPTKNLFIVHSAPRGIRGGAIGIWQALQVLLGEMRGGRRMVGVLCLARLSFLPMDMDGIVGCKAVIWTLFPTPSSLSSNCKFSTSSYKFILSLQLPSPPPLHLIHPRSFIAPWIYHLFMCCATVQDPPKVSSTMPHTLTNYD